MEISLSGFLSGFLVAGLLWAAREVVGISLNKAAARSGNIGYVSSGCGFYCGGETEDGRKIEALFWPDNMFKDQDPLPLRCTGELYNDTDVQLLLKQPSVHFFHPHGLRTTHRTPKMLVNDEPTSVITVPAHGTCRVSLFLNLFRADLDDTYAGAIPVLHVTSASGKEFDFRLSATSFYGERIAGWPRKGRLPIFVTDVRSSDEDIGGEASGAV